MELFVINLKFRYRLDRFFSGISLRLRAYMFRSSDMIYSCKYSGNGMTAPLPFCSSVHPTETLCTIFFPDPSMDTYDFSSFQKVFFATLQPLWQLCMKAHFVVPYSSEMSAMVYDVWFYHSMLASCNAFFIAFLWFLHNGLSLCKPESPSVAIRCSPIAQIVKINACTEY